MAAPDDLVWRSGELKRALLEFARGRRYRRTLEKALAKRSGREIVRDEGELMSLLDHFLLEYRQPDGRTLVEHFVAAHPDLPRAEREMLLGWRDLVEGIFEIERQEGQALVLRNLVDELTYHARSNSGSDVFARMPAGSFLVTRLVPIADEWLLSGSQQVLDASDRARLYELARELALSSSSLAFRNPRKLEQGWEMQREERRDFIAFFGSDLVVLPGRELAERMRAFHHYRAYEVRDAEGKSIADRAKEAYGRVPPLPDVTLPEDRLEAETVGLIYDEVEGLNFHRDFGLVEETFERPELAAEPRHRKAVLGYLREPSITPLPFRRLAERDPQRASPVFRRVLGQARFTWEQDGEALLRRYKASYFKRTPLPSIVPIGETLAREQLSGSKAPGGAPSDRWRPWGDC